MNNIFTLESKRKEDIKYKLKKYIRVTEDKLIVVDFENLEGIDSSIVKMEIIRLVQEKILSESYEMINNISNYILEQGKTVDEVSLKFNIDTDQKWLHKKLR